jgi:sulfotransferase family protein
VQVNQDTGPLFLVGVWRSGTSLLQTLLNQHSQIGLMYEAELPLLKPLFAGGAPKADWLERWDFWNSALTRHRIEPRAVLPRSSHLRSAAETVYRSYALQSGAVIFGEKSPNYWDSLERLSKTFPFARFIILWRNPLAICRSVKSAGKSEPYFAKRGMLLRTLLACEKLKRQRDRLVARGVRLHELHYEELVRDPAATLQDICGFLDIPLESRMITLEDADRLSIYAGKHHSLVKGDHIVPSQKRPENLPKKFKEKADRYVVLWREQSFGTFPLYASVDMENSRKPGLLERLGDRLLFWLLRRLDATVVWIYCWAPLSLLKAWRARRRQGELAVEAETGS